MSLVDDLENDSLSEGYHYQSEMFVVKTSFQKKPKVKANFRPSTIYNDSSPEPRTTPSFSKKLLKSFDNEKSDFQSFSKQ